MLLLQHGVNNQRPCLLLNHQGSIYLIAIAHQPRPLLQLMNAVIQVSLIKLLTELVLLRFAQVPVIVIVAEQSVENVQAVLCCRLLEELANKEARVNQLLERFVVWT